MIKAKAVQFLESLGFQDVRPIAGTEIRMMVRTSLKAVRKQLRASNMKFMPSGITNSTPNSSVQEFLVVQQRQVIGRIKVEAFAVHTVIQLEQV